MDEKKTNRSEQFVRYVFEQSRKSTGFKAHLRCGDNPDREDQSWGELARFGVDLRRDEERLPFATIGAAICRSDAAQDGKLGIGSALALCFDNQDYTGGEEGSNKEKPGASRLRRLLSCSDTSEACRVLRPILRLITSKADGSLCYAQLLQDLLYFERGGAERSKRQWAMDFYNNRSNSSGESAESGEEDMPSVQEDS